MCIRDRSTAVSDAKKENVYLSIDLKSFYASVECRERGLDPMKTNLVVADAGRTEKTICLAVSPSLKAYGTVSYTHLHRREEDRMRMDGIFPAIAVWHM